MTTRSRPPAVNFVDRRLLYRRRRFRRMAAIVVVSSPGMAGDQSSPSDSEPRVVSFRRGQSRARPPADPPPVQDLAKFERAEGPDDYRHRMIMNAVAFLFVIALIGAGIWLADTMARMRKDQDCVLSGRRGCTPVEVIKERW
jgi:hypothetical protein